MIKFTTQSFRIIGLFVMVSVFLPLTARSQSMSEFLQSSYDNHPELLYQTQRLYQQYEGSYSRAVGGLLPELDYSYSSTYSRGVQSRGGVTGNTRRKATTWSLSQNLFSSFTDYYQLRGFLDTAHALEMSYYASEQGFMFNTIDAYLQVIRADNVVRVRESNYGSLKERLNIVERLYNVGDTTELDLRQAKVQLLTAESDLEDALASYDSALATFKRYGNIEADKNHMSLPISPTTLPSSLGAVEEALLKGNFELRALDAFQDASKSAYRAALGTAGISVNFSVSYQTSRSDTGVRNGAPTGTVASSYSDGVTSTVQVSLPVYDPTRSAAIRGAHKSYLQAKNDYIRQKLSNLGNVQSQWATYDRLARSVELRREAVDSAKIALENVELQRRAGLRSVFEVLEEERRLVNAQVGYETARYDYLRSAYQILLLMGRLTAKDLGLKTHYGEELASYFESNKYLGSLPGAYTAVRGLGGEFASE